MTVKDSSDQSWPRGLKIFWILIYATFGMIQIGELQKLVLLPPGAQDFVQEWTSARNYFTGEPIYTPMAQSVPRHLDAEWDGPMAVSAHPPASVVLGLPFGKLDYRSAFIAWAIFTTAAMVVSVLLIVFQRDLGFSPWVLLPIFVLILISNPYSQQVRLGQLKPILLLLLVLGWVALRRDKPILGGALIGLAAVVKLFPLFFVVYFIAQKQWRALAAMAGAVVLTTLVTIGVLGWQAHLDYIREVMPNSSQFYDHWLNASLFGFVHRLFDTQSGQVTPLMQAPLVAKALVGLGAIAITALCGWLSWQAKSRRQRDLAFGLCIVGMILLSPIAWDHYFLLLVLPLALLWAYANDLTESSSVFRDTHAVVAGIVLLLGMIRPMWLWGPAIPGDGPFAVEPAVRSVATWWQSLVVISYPFYCLVGLLAFQAWKLWPRQPTEDQ